MGVPQLFVAATSAMQYQAQGKIGKFISDNTLLNQMWIMDPKQKVSDILKGSKIIDFIRYKVGEGV